MDVRYYVYVRNCRRATFMKNVTKWLFGKITKYRPSLFAYIFLDIYINIDIQYINKKKTSYITKEKSFLAILHVPLCSENFLFKLFVRISLFIAQPRIENKN